MDSEIRRLPVKSGVLTGLEFPPKMVGVYSPTLSPWPAWTSCGLGMPAMYSIASSG